MADVKFQIGADVLELVNAQNAVIAKQTEAEKAFGRAADAAVAGNRRIAQSLMDVALVERKVTEGRLNMESLRFSGSAARSNARAYMLAPVVAPSNVATAIAQYSGQSVYRLAGELQMAPASMGADPFTSRHTTEQIASQIRATAAQRAMMVMNANDALKAGRPKAIAAADEETRSEIMGGVPRLAMAAAGGLYMLDEAMQKYAGIAHRAGEANIEFQHSMAPLLSLGDNAKNIGKVEDSVLNLSETWGRAPAEVASAMANVQRAMHGAGGSQQQDMLRSARELTEIIGGDMNENLQTSTKLWQAWGDGVGSAAAVNAKLMHLYKGGVPVSEFPMIAAITPAAKAAGFTPDETLALFETTTNIGGKDSQLAKAGRELFSHFDTMKEHGLSVHGSLTDKVEQFAQFGKANPDLVSQFAGRGGAVLMKELSSRIGQLEETRSELQNITVDTLQTLSIGRIANPIVGAAADSASIKQSLANVDARRGADPELSRLDQNLGFAEIGYKMQPHAAVWEAIKPESWKKIQYEIADGSAGSFGGAQLAAGLHDQISRWRASGSPEDAARADLQSIAHGSYLNLHYHDEFKDQFRIHKNDGSIDYTGPNSAKIIAGLLPQLPDMKLNEELQYLQIRESGGDKAAGSFFKGLQRDRKLDRFNRSTAEGPVMEGMGAVAMRLSMVGMGAAGPGGIAAMPAMAAGGATNMESAMLGIFEKAAQIMADKISSAVGFAMFGGGSGGPSTQPTTQPTTRPATQPSPLPFSFSQPHSE